MEVINKLGYCCFGKIGIAYLRKYYIPSGMRKECIKNVYYFVLPWINSSMCFIKSLPQYAGKLISFIDYESRRIIYFQMYISILLMPTKSLLIYRRKRIARSIQFRITLEVWFTYYSEIKIKRHREQPHCPVIITVGQIIVEQEKA